MPTYGDNANNTTTPRFTNVDVSDIKVFQRKRRSNNLLFKLGKDKARLIMMTSTFVTAILSFTFIILIIKTRRDTSLQVTKFNELNFQYENTKTQNQALTQRLKRDVNDCQNTKDRLNSIGEDVKNKKTQYDSLKNDNEELIKEQNSYLALEEEIQREKKVLLDKSNFMEQIKHDSFYVPPFFHRRLSHPFHHILDEFLY